MPAVKETLHSQQHYGLRQEPIGHVYISAAQGFLWLHADVPDKTAAAHDRLQNHIKEPNIVIRTLSCMFRVPVLPALDKA